MCKVVKPQNVHFRSQAAFVQFLLENIIVVINNILAHVIQVFPRLKGQMKLSCSMELIINFVKSF